MSDNIKVVVKVRPLIFREIEDKHSYQWRINNNTLYQIDQNGKDCGPSFTFDKVYDTETRTHDVYNDIAKPIVEAATAGFNGTIFAYGQTSSGKTYTMTGTDDAPGIIPLAVLNLFDIIRSIPDRDFLVRVSYVEIYNESFIDLLDLTKKVKIQETLQGIRVCTTEKLTISPDEVLELMRQGKANRQTGSTNMNEESSRSHSIFQITIESREHIEGEQEVGSVNVSQLNLVDLAGSERSGQTGATGIRFKEGTHINKSLSSLALVIKQLSEDPNKHVNYRDSKLTRILQNSLGGNAKTSIICAVTPAAVEETISTLQFANRAKAIKNTPAVNLVTTNATMIQSLTKQLSSLKTQLESKKNVEQDNYNLQKQIANLQKMILNGFGQNRNTDIISTARRKLIQPRRVTISTLHPIQEDPMPLVPKFCTPSLKYNPMSVGVSAAAPIQSASSAPSIVHCDVIEIDSEDENTSDIYPCSPYHDCYNKSKTPPCVLRKNAKQAEKNLMDIVELTEREKIYAPNVVELMEQLEHKSLALTNLQENIANLHSKLKDKDEEIEIIKSNITEAQYEIESLASVKAQLETTCNSYSTKITDLEVSFETLKKKSKSREDELLSLLKEHEDKKKNEAIGKLSSKAVEKELKNFMDLSRDISLVNSSVENSIIETEMRQNCCVDTRSQVTLRDQTILQLEANLHAQKLKIDNIESINEKLQVTVSSLNDKLSLMETENTNLKYSMESLSKTISSQKSLIDIANTDIESYCSAISELKIKLHQKENVLTDISDTDIETMIANEEMFIANNENMKNIIQSLKIALDLRNKEINKLKSDQSSTDERFSLLSNNENLSSVEEFDSMKNEISSLTNEVERLKNEVTDNVSVIDTLLQEKNKMINVEKQLTLKFTEIQEQKDLLDKEIEVHIDEMTKLKDSNNKLTEEVKAKQEEIISINKENDNKNKDLSQKIVKLEAVIKNKESIIASLKKEQNGTRENIEKAKLGLTKVQNIITLLSGDINVLPEFIDDLVVAFSTLGDSLTSLENIAKDTIKEKKCVIAKLEQSEIELNTLHTKINGLSETVDEFYNEYETLMLEHSNRDKLVNSDMNAFDKLVYKINNLLSIIKSTQIALNQTIKDKNAEISEFKIKYENKSKELNEESQKNNIQKQQISDLTSSQNLILNNIFEKATNITFKFCIENNISCHLKNVCKNIYEQVILTMDKIDNYISLLQSEHSKCDNIEHVFGDAENKIQQLTEENLKLIQDISELETSKAILSDEIQEVQEESKNLRNDLQSTNDLLNQLRQHLSAKASEIEIIENKAKSWKDSFTDLESMMQNKINLLEADNFKLKSKCSELEMQDLTKCYDNENFASGDQECNSRKQHYIQVNSPPSLLTICCNRIADAIDFNDDNSVTSSSSLTELNESKMSTNKCNCKDLLADLQNQVEEKNNLNMTIERLQNENKDLLKEREDVQKEVQLLLEHSYELQKRVVNHRTILSTLTATTYAENKSLSSQIKFLQHHHSRFHHVCQKVIPTFKKQLYDLMTLLKSECLGKHNESFKRYSLPNALDTSSLHSTFKNESIFDNDLLMLDTNVTLTTCDNTITAHDQTCFDVTQVWVSNEVACQTNFSEVTKDSLYSQMYLESLDENKILETLESLKIENDKLRVLVDNFTKNKSKVLVPTLSSPIKFPCTTENSCKQCDQYVDDIRISNDSHKKEMDAMSKKLSDLECEKNTISEKCRNLALEVPSSEALVRRFSALEEELQIKLKEIERLTVLLSKTNKTLKSLQEENESLSNELMENISEIDVLKSEQDTLKETNTKLSEKLSVLGKELKSFESEKKPKPICKNCALKDQTINSLEKRLSATESHSKLDRSYSDADSSSRYNKICTLQNELHAGKEDCIELKEEVTTIKKHLEHSNLSISQNMDLDESVIDSQMYSFNKDFGNTPENKFNLSNVQEKRVMDLYISDKTDCLSYYCEKTGADKESLGDFKILEVMKMLYVNFSTKHANEIQNLVNKLKDLEEAKSEYNLQAQLNKLKEEQKAVLKDLKEKDGYVQKLAEIVSHIRNNISLINEELDSEDALIVFRTNFLKILDTELGLTSSNIFESIIQQLNKKYNKVIDRNNAEIEKLKDTTERMDIELKSVTDNLLSLRSQLSEKEMEFELLQRQKEKMHEISNAVTIDIIRKDKELRSQLTHYYQKLINSNIIKEDIELSLSLNESLNKLFSFILNQLENKESEEKEKLNIISELENLKTSLLQKDEELKLLNENFNRIVTEHEHKLFTQTTLHNDLNKIYAKKVEENEMNAIAINKLTEEINILKNNISSKEALINSLETKHSKDLLERQSEQLQVLKKLQNVEKELEDLKSINQHILMEKQACAIELESVSNILNQKNLEIDKFVSEIDKLKQSLQESSQVIENLKNKSNTLLQEKCSNCVRLETNIKTHEKTAAIQITIINRLQEQKADFVKSNGEKDKQIEAITQKCKSLEEECLKHTKEIQKAKEEIETLSSSKQILELRVSELETLDVKPRLSIDSVAGTTRRRRQSIHDSKRIFADDVQGTMKSRSKTDDLFMDVDEDSSSRSTPIRLNRGRDSLLSKHDQSDKDEEQSRPGSAAAMAAATRRRRRTAHDTRRGTENSFESSGSLDSEAAHFRTLLSVCQEELEELRQRYKEVDEECETCAQYLRERDEQCLRLKREKVVLEKTIMDLREKMNSNNSTNTKATFTDASVNTEEDWTNLHSVFVDRMSYDAEVEKNKKLIRTIEELRFKKQDLKNTMTKMQKALDKKVNTENSSSQALESTKSELATCRQELEELKERYKELDEECETCAEYLRERDEQCQKLKEAKAVLESKLEEYQQSSIVHSVRKRRQTLHDQNRRTPGSVDATTETSDDLLSYQVERDDSKLKQDETKEIKRLKMVVDKLSQHKASLEQQLTSVGTQYVATGSAIVQNQQLSDVMKENQKLKKINAKLVTICKKRGKSFIDSIIENEDPSQKN